MPQTQVISSPLPVNRSTDKILEKRAKENPLGGRFGFNLIINLAVIVIAGLPFVVPSYITMGINCVYTVSWVVFVTLAAIMQFRIKNYLKTFDSSKQLPENVTKTKLIMATFVYKEPLDLILSTLKNLSEQKIAGEVITVVCMEERTPERQIKINKIVSEFSKSFGRLFITVHPYGTEGEIPGKCSNNNYAIRSIVQELEQTENFNPEDYVVTNFDIDTMFHPKFLEIVQRVTSEEKERSSVVWQPVLYYNWDLDKLSFFTRITGLVRNIFMMGALVPFDINIMSVYTASLKLYMDGNYCHPAYQMEDIICYIRWLTITKRSLTIKPILCPTISGPTSGKNMIHEFAEWARQGRRWSIGSAEVFHYFCVKAKRIGFLPALRWAITYLHYYAGFLCGQTFLMITTTIVISLDLGIGPHVIPQLYFLIPLGVVYGCLLMVILLNKYALNTYLKELNIVEKIPLYKDMLHWISSLFVTIAYSFVVAYGFFELLFQGKKVCKHGASSKANLGATKIDEVQIEVAGC